MANNEVKMNSETVKALSFVEMASTVDTIVSSVIISNNGKSDFGAEYLEVVKYYVLIATFYPEHNVTEQGLALFFNDYVEGKYKIEIKRLEQNEYAQYVLRAVDKKLEFEIKRIESPIINSIERFVGLANDLLQKYVDDIDNIGTADIKGFLGDFAALAKNTTSEKIAKAVYDEQAKNEQAEAEKAVKPARKTNSKPKKLA